MGVYTWPWAFPVKGNPLKDLRVFQNADALHLIMKGGQLYKRAL